MPTPRYKIATGRRPYTPTASSAAADHPVTNLGGDAATNLHAYPSRTWEDDGTGVGSWVRADLGAGPPALVACVLYGSVRMAARTPAATVTSWTVEESADGATGWAAIPESPIAVPVDLRSGARKAWAAISTTQRYIRFTAAALAAGETVARLGVLELYAAGDVVELGQNPSAPEYEIIDPLTVFEPDGGGHAVNEDGPPYARFALSGRWFRKYGVDDQIDALRALGTSRVMALYENAGDASHVYLMRRLLASTFVPGNAAFLDTGLGFREVT